MSWNGRRGRLELNCKVYCQLSKMCLFVPAFTIIIFVWTRDTWNLAFSLVCFCLERAGIDRVHFVFLTEGVLKKVSKKRELLFSLYSRSSFELHWRICFGSLWIGYSFLVQLIISLQSAAERVMIVILLFKFAERLFGYHDRLVYKAVDFVICAKRNHCTVLLLRKIGLRLMNFMRLMASFC